MDKLKTDDNGMNKMLVRNTQDGIASLDELSTASKATSGL